MNKTGILYYEEEKDFLSALKMLTAYHRTKGRSLEEIWANAGRVGDVSEYDGVRVVPDKMLMHNYFWFVTGDEVD